METAVMTDNMLIDRLAQQVLHWDIGADRFLPGDRSWIPKWKFNPLEHLEDAFRLLDHSQAMRYSISQSGGSFTVEVKQGAGSARPQGSRSPGPSRWRWRAAWD
jgi:hypothetical protein